MKISLTEFIGFREMLWIMNVLDLKSPAQDVRQQQLYFLKDVADHIYSPVAILDFQAQVVLAYDIEIMSINGIMACHLCKRLTY